MKRFANAQAMAIVANRQEFSGSVDLGRNADPDTWLTPRFILSQLGPFDLDPCAAEQNPAWVCPRAFTIADDGLNQDWTGRVFLNPPFSNTVPWLTKHAQHGNGVALVPASVESVIWRELVWRKAKLILLLHGRTRFCNPDGSTTTGRPLRSVCLIAWNFREAALLNACALAGVRLSGWIQH